MRLGRSAVGLSLHCKHVAPATRPSQSSFEGALAISLLLVMRRIFLSRARTTLGTVTLLPGEHSTYMLTWSPELISDRMALERCLKEAIHLRGCIETAALALTLAANAAWEPTRNPVKYPLHPRRPPLDRMRAPTGGGSREPPPTPPTAAPQRPTPRATATSGPPPPPPPPSRHGHARIMKQLVKQRRTRQELGWHL